MIYGKIKLQNLNLDKYYWCVINTLKAYYWNKVRYYFVGF